MIAKSLLSRHADSVCHLLETAGGIPHAYVVSALGSGWSWQQSVWQPQGHLLETAGGIPHAYISSALSSGWSWQQSVWQPQGHHLLATGGKVWYAFFLLQWQVGLLIVDVYWMA
jgi:uncharacterized protein YfiM (DUF2279 family)